MFSVKKRIWPSHLHSNYTFNCWKFQRLYERLNIFYNANPVHTLFTAFKEVYTLAVDYCSTSGSPSFCYCPISTIPDSNRAWVTSYFCKDRLLLQPVVQSFQKDIKSVNSSLLQNRQSQSPGLLEFWTSFQTTFSNGSSLHTILCKRNIR